MPKRPSLSNRLGRKLLGREAFLPGPPLPTTDHGGITIKGQRPAVDRLRSTVEERGVTVDGRPSHSKRAGASRGEAWEAQHKRVTFYCPTELLTRIEEEIIRSGASKTAVIIDAVRADFSKR